VELNGFAAFKGKSPVGLLTYRIEGSDCEIVTIDSASEREGIGTALIGAVEERAKAKGCRRLWLITTNDNLNALGFYQRRGFRLTALYPNALEASRKLKPEISMKAAKVFRSGMSWNLNWSCRDKTILRRQNIAQKDVLRKLRSGYFFLSLSHHFR